MNARLSSALLVCFTVIAGCDGEYAVRIAFEDSAQSSRAERVQVALVNSCSSQPLGEEPLLPVREVSFEAGMASPSIGSVPPRTYGLYARVMAGCRVIASGCNDVDVEAAGSDTLRVVVGNLDVPLCETGQSCVDGQCAGGDGGVDATVDGMVDAVVSDASDGGVDSGLDPEPPPPVSTRCWAEAETCDWSRPGFRFAEVATGNFIDPDAANVAFSPDACSLYLARNDGVDFDVSRVDRDGPGGEFGVETPLTTNINTVADEDATSLGPNGLELFVASNRGPSGFRRVHRFERESTDADWEPNGVRIGSLEIAGSTSWEPRLAPHGLRLYVALLTGVQWISVIERASLDDEFGPPQMLDLQGITPSYSINRPSVTHDGRILVGVQQDADSATRRAFFSTRDGWNEEWSPIRVLPVTVGADGMRDIGVSPDGCEVIVRTTQEAGNIAALLRYEAP